MRIFKDGSRALSAVAVLAAGGLLAVSTLAGVASGASKPSPRLSASELDAFNITPTEAVGLFGASVNVDTSTAATTDLSKATSISGKYMYKLDKGMGGVLPAVGAPSYTFTAPDNSYLLFFSSKVVPANGNGEAVAPGLAKVLFSSGDGVAGFKISGHIAESNPQFPVGTYGSTLNGSIAVGGATYPTKVLLVVSGEGGRMAVYAMAFVELSKGASTTGSQSAAFKKYEALIIKKAAGGPVTRV